MIEITLNMNPNILPTQKEWRLICAMVKQQSELTDEEINEVFKSIYGHNNSYINSSLFKFVRTILQKASEK
jgi:hypothetical protein